MDITAEGLRIQIVDERNRPMFDQSSASLKPYTQELLQAIGRTLNRVPNSISLTGHTDATKYAGASAASVTGSYLPTARMPRVGSWWPAAWRRRRSFGWSDWPTRFHSIPPIRPRRPIAVSPSWSSTATRPPHRVSGRGRWRWIPGPGGSPAGRVENCRHEPRRAAGRACRGRCKTPERRSFRERYRALTGN